MISECGNYDIPWRVHPIGSGMHAEFTLTNGIKISIVFGSLFYSNGIDTYEIWAMNADGKEYDDPTGYLTAMEVCEYIERAEELQ